MIRAHKGYLKTEARLIADNNLAVTIPADRIITILWEETSEMNTLAQSQNEALKKFRAGVKEIKDEPIDDEFLKIVNSGITIDSGADL